jgi:hypothetical protein
MTITCETCRFWQAIPRPNQSDNYGTCRRNPPVRIAGEQDGWPTVPDYGTCGEHQPRTADSKADIGELRAALTWLHRAANDMVIGIGVHNERRPDERIEGPIPDALARAVTNARAFLND